MSRALLIAIMVVGALGGVATLASASPSGDAPATVEPTPATQGSKSLSYAAVIAGCLGVVFGGLIARWQIKSLQRRNR